VRAMCVEVGLVLGEDLVQVAGVREEDPVQKFTATRRLACSTTAKQYSRANVIVSA
jgi:hypothetical protein